MDTPSPKQDRCNPAAKVLVVVLLVQDSVPVYRIEEGLERPQGRGALEVALAVCLNLTRMRCYHDIFVHHDPHNRVRRIGVIGSESIQYTRCNVDRALSVGMVGQVG